LKGKGDSDKAGSSPLRNLSAGFDLLARRGMVAAGQFADFFDGQEFRGKRDRGWPVDWIP
jgi:hypothetical protein